ncbi:MAG: hybrid sensor histidine kinase/response regulator [Myxococcota bacterium]
MDMDFKAYKILYVDDDKNLLSAFQLAFGEDFELVTTTSPEEALAMVRNGKDLAVLLADQRMPGMNGAQLLSEARRIRPELVRMLVTAYSDLDAVVAAVNDGQITRYLAKPWRHDEMAGALRNGVEYFHMSQRLRDLQLELFKLSRQSVATVVLDELAHELGNPLSVVRANITLVDHALGELTALAKPLGLSDAVGRLQELKEACVDAQGGVELMHAVLSRVRKREYGSARVNQVVPVDLGLTLQSTVRLVPGALAGRGRISVELEPQLPRLQSDPTAITQILLNLLINACHALPDVGTQEIRVHAARVGGRLKIGVTDTGCGIAPENLTRVFEPRFTTRGDQDGNGLGLAVSRDLALQLGGDLTCTSQLGKGSTFELDLPWVPLEE